MPDLMLHERPLLDYQQNGKPEKREQYLKPEFAAQSADKSKAKAKDKTQAQEMSV
jgi:hypothetical protein